VSCATGEYELVGIFHAGYTGGSAMNVVVGIDQVREMMATLKRVPRNHRDDDVALDGTSRAAVQAALGPAKEMFFPFGPAVALVRGSAPDGTLLFAVFAKDFPFAAEPLLVIEDLPGPAHAFGEVGRTWFGSARGLKAYDRASLDAETQQQTARVLEALRGDAVDHAAYRRASADDLGTRQASDRVRRMSKALSRTATTRGDTFQIVADLADKLAPPAGERGTTLGALAVAARPPDRPAGDLHAGRELPERHEGPAQPHVVQ